MRIDLCDLYQKKKNSAQKISVHVYMEKKGNMEKNGELNTGKYYVRVNHTRNM